MNNQKRSIETAIWYWNEKLKGTVFWWDKNNYSKEFILSQIEFFNKMHFI